MLNVFSFGGGVQSMAVLVLAAQGKVDYKTFLFCNVGADSEHPDTLTYVKEIAQPYALKHGLHLIELQKIKRDGQTETIYQRLTRPGSRSIGIPVRMSNGAPGRRSCTVDFKIEVCDHWLKDHGVNMALAFEKKLAKMLARDREMDLLSLSSDELLALARFPRPLARVGLGISLDEFQRMRNDSGVEWKKLEYPLIDLRIDRNQCKEIIRRADLPVPPKSSCWFCPYHSLSVWQEMRLHQPDLFQKAVALEHLINERRLTLGRDEVWFHGKLKPLDKITTDYEQPLLFDDEPPCESGYCFV